METPSQPSTPLGWIQPASTHPNRALHLPNQHQNKPRREVQRSKKKKEKKAVKLPHPAAAGVHLLWPGSSSADPPRPRRSVCARTRPTKAYAIAGRGSGVHAAGQTHVGVVETFQ